MERITINGFGLRDCNFNKFFTGFFIFMLLAWSNSTLALSAQDVFVNTSKNNSIIIELNSSISDDGSGLPLVVSINSLPEAGLAELVGDTSIRYQPNADFTGNDQFSYSVSDGAAAPVIANIHVTVGEIISLPVSNSSSDILEISIGDTLNEICSTQPDSNLQQRCNELAQATDEEKVQALREIAPEEVATQNKLADAFALTQLSNVAKRLSALRRGSQGLSLGQLSFRWNDAALSAGDLSSSFQQQENSSASDKFGLLGNRLGIFVSGDVSHGSRDNTANEDGFKYQTRGLTAGLDYRLSRQWVAGLAAGYANSNLDIDAKGGELDASAISFILYASYYPQDNFFLDLIYSSSRNNYDLTRHIEYSAAGNQVVADANASTDSQLHAVSLAAGYVLMQRQSLTVQSIAKLDYLRSVIDAYAESGADEFNLKIDEQKYSSTLFSLGVQVSKAMSQSWGVMVPQLDIAWEHALDSGADSIKGSFVTDPANTKFEFNTDEIDTDYLRASVGASFVFKGGKNAFVMYETILGKAYTTQNHISVGVRMEL